MVSRLDVMEDISFPYMTREMAAVLRRSRVAAVEHNNFNIRQLANPYHGYVGFFPLSLSLSYIYNWSISDATAQSVYAY